MIIFFYHPGRVGAMLCNGDIFSPWRDHIGRLEAPYLLDLTDPGLKGAVFSGAPTMLRASANK